MRKNAFADVRMCRYGSVQMIGTFSCLHVLTFVHTNICTFSYQHIHYAYSLAIFINSVYFHFLHEG